MANEIYNTSIGVGFSATVVGSVCPFRLTMNSVAARCRTVLQIASEQCCRSLPSWIDYVADRFLLESTVLWIASFLCPWIDSGCSYTRPLSCRFLRSTSVAACFVFVFFFAFSWIARGPSSWLRLRWLRLRRAAQRLLQRLLQRLRQGISFSVWFSGGFRRRVWVDVFW